MATNIQDDLTYDYFPYDKGVLGKCREVPALSAQGKSQDEVCGILHRMAEHYFKLNAQLKTKKL